MSVLLCKQMKRLIYSAGILLVMASLFHYFTKRKPSVQSPPYFWSMSSKESANFIVQHGRDIDAISRVARDPETFKQLAESQREMLLSDMDKDGVLSASVPSAPGKLGVIAGYGQRGSSYLIIVDKVQSWHQDKWANLSVRSAAGWVLFPDSGKWKRIVVLEGTALDASNKGFDWRLDIDANGAAIAPGVTVQP